MRSPMQGCRRAELWCSFIRQGMLLGDRGLNEADVPTTRVIACRVDTVRRFHSS
jgi:hypothetical protein